MHYPQHWYLLASFPQQSCFSQSCSSICDEFCPLILFRLEEEPRLLILAGDQTKLSGNLRPSTCCVPLLFTNPLSRMSNLCTAFALIFYVPPLRSLILTISMQQRITKTSEALEVISFNLPCTAHATVWSEACYQYSRLSQVLSGLMW